MPSARCASQDLITVRASALSPVPAGVTHAAPDRWHVRVVLLPGMPGTQTSSNPVTAPLSCPRIQEGGTHDRSSSRPRAPGTPLRSPGSGTHNGR